MKYLFLPLVGLLGALLFLSICVLTITQRMADTCWQIYLTSVGGWYEQDKAVVYGTRPSGAQDHRFEST